MRYTKNHVNELVEQVKRLTKNENYITDYNSFYGGWRLVKTDEHWTHHGAFNKSDICDRMETRVFVAYLEGLIGGLTFGK